LNNPKTTEQKGRKMKNNIIIGAIVALTTVAANAAITPQQRADMCNKAAGTTWVSKTESCVPFHACDDEKFAAYCNKFFNTTQVSSGTEAQELIDLYVKRHMGYANGCTFRDTDKPGAKTFGQD
jgi:hypothetical protein